MPSPLAHAATGFLISRLPRPYAVPAQATLVPIGFSLLPDIDAVAGLLAGDMAGYHNWGTHSLLVGLLIALTFAVIAWRWWGFSIPLWFGLAFGGYAGHLLMDAATLDNRGVMLLWPLADTRFNAPVTLFYGVRWGAGILSSAHLITLASEVGYSIIVVIAALLIRRFRQRISPD